MDSEEYQQLLKESETVKPDTYKKDKNEYLFQEGHLVIVTNGLKRRVLRSWEKEAVLQQAHASPTSAHFRVAATTKKLKKRFWWPNMFQEIKEFVESCDACQRKNPAVKSQPLHPIKVTGPFDQIGIDIVGRLPKSKRGNQYIIVAVDYFTKWPEARAIEDIKASTVAQFIFEDIIARHGCPKEI